MWRQEVRKGRWRTDATERCVYSEQKGKWFAKMVNRLQASKNSAWPGVSVQYLGVEFHSQENLERLHKAAAWNSGRRVNYSWCAAWTRGVKQGQNFPSRWNCATQKQTWQRLMTQRSFILKNGFCLNIFAHCGKDVGRAFGHDNCFFLAAAYEPPRYHSED